MPQSQPLPDPRTNRIPNGPESEPVAGDFFRDQEEPRARELDRDSDEVQERLVADDDGDEQSSPREQQRLGTSYLERTQGDQSQKRWRQIQANFVDDPKNAVSEAHALVSDLIDGIVEQFQREKSDLEGRWSKGDQVSTEDLRLCLQRYRDFFGRLLPTRQLEDIHRDSLP
jgi:hypothetical protein